MTHAVTDASSHPLTVEDWARHVIATRVLDEKLNPEPPPAYWEEDPTPERVPTPGRAPELTIVERAERRPRAGALASPAARAQLIHTFWHHEVQAAELFLWALLAFPETPRRFRRGLVALALEELRHAHLYADHLVRLGSRPGAFPVRDWFWERVPSVPDAPAFVALVGLGLEGGNLEHAARFAALFESSGDHVGARLLTRVGQDEIAHVRFARRWFERWRGPLSFERWRAELPAPLTPTVLRGRPLNRTARRAAGFDDAFVEALEAWGGAPGGAPVGDPDGDPDGAGRGTTHAAS